MPCLWIPGAIGEFRLRLKIEICHSLLSQMGMVAFLPRDLKGMVVEQEGHFPIFKRMGATHEA